MKVKVCSAIFIQVLHVLCLYWAHISGERLQDQWSSGSGILIVLPKISSFL